MLITQPYESLAWTLSWRTDLLKGMDGLEQRVALLRSPRESYAFQFVLNEQELRDIRRQLVVDATTPIQVPLRHEGLLLSAEPTADLVAGNIPFADWATVDREVLVESDLGYHYATTITDVHGAYLTVADVPVDPGHYPAYKTNVSPLVDVQAADGLSVARHAVNAGKFTLTGYDTAFHTTWGAGIGGAFTTLDSYVIVDWVSVPLMGDLARETFSAGLTVLDAGAAREVIQRRDAADIRREHTFRWAAPAYRQLWKAFLYRQRGRCKPCLLSTFRDDLVLRSQPSIAATTLVVEDRDDYLAWFAASAAQARLALATADGTQYVKVTNAVASASDTITLTISAGVANVPITRVSFLELCRFDTDDVVVKIDQGHQAEMDLASVVVQR